MKVKVKKSAKSGKQLKTRQIQAPAPPKEGTIVSMFYKLTRGTPFFTANLRASDFSAQVFESGKLAAAEQFVVTRGRGGVTVSQMPVKGKMADLKDGRLFDLTGIKRHEILPTGGVAAKWASKNGKRHKVKILGESKMAGVHDGYLIGDLSQMYLGFITHDGRKSWTLETRAIQKGRNGHHRFELVQ